MARDGRWNSALAKCSRSLRQFRVICGARFTNENVSDVYQKRSRVEAVSNHRPLEEDATVAPLRIGELGGGGGGGGGGVGVASCGRGVQDGFLTSSWAIIVVWGSERGILEQWKTYR